MTVLGLLLFLAAGRALTWLAQSNGLLKRLRDKWELFDEFMACDLCVGFWVYLALALWAPPPFALWPWPIGAVALAGLSTIGAYLLRLGWQAGFGVTIIE